MRLPRTFRSLRALRVLNLAAVGTSLAAMTAVVFADAVSAARAAHFMAAVACATVFYGVAWAGILRTRARVGQFSARKRGLRWGWLASFPLAAANAATACGLVFAAEGSHRVSEFLIGCALGATVGAIFWVPALALTLVCFGLPIAWAQQRAQQGLAGEESGEVIVGVVSATISALAFVVGIDLARTWSFASLHYGHVLVATFGTVGWIAGTVAAGLARQRERARRAFVHEVEAGNVKGYRVDATVEGKVLVEVTGMGEGYRVANFEQPVFVLGEEGEAHRSLEMVSGR